MGWRAVLVVLIGLTAVAVSGTAEAARRAALVIGIDSYDAVPDLAKAVGDAQAMAEKLRALGFEVTEALNPDRRALNQAISTFSASLGTTDTAFVHFSGHGVEIDGENYLLPADIPAPRAGQRDFVKSEAIGMSDLIARIAAGGARTRVFVIDACRDNPFARTGARSVGGMRGLARIEAPAGTFIMYSAGYRQQALDALGPGDPAATSVYTRVLLKHLGTPGRAIDDVAQDVRREVEQLARRAGHRQRPAYYDELSARLVLVPPVAARVDSIPGNARPPLSEVAQAWAVTKDTTSSAVLRAFIARFKGTVYADLAAARLKELTAGGDSGTGIAAIDPAATKAADPVAKETADGATAAAKLAEEAEALFGRKQYDKALGPARRAADAGNARGMWLLGRLYSAGKAVKADQEQALTLFRRAAEAGFPPAMVSLGLSYKYGHAGEKDEAEGVRWLKRAAEAGDVDGMINLAFSYSDGKGVPKDDKEYWRWVSAAADKDSPIALTLVGTGYEYGRHVVTKDVPKAIEYYKRAAALGYANAFYYLGQIYQEGRGVPKNAKTALVYYRGAAERNQTSAMLSLSRMYAAGEGVARSESEALRWLKASAEAGYTPAMVDLGLAYMKGTLVPKNPVEGVRWFKRAAEKRNPQAMVNLALAYDNGLGVAKDKAESWRWMSAAAEAGDPGALYNLGVAYETGSGVAKDEAKAAGFYRRAADKYNPKAMTNLARLYYDGRGVPRDQAEAARLYERAARLGETSAMANLGRMYAAGRGVPKDDKQAAHWFAMAAARGHPGGKFGLGLHYEHGWGVSKNSRAAARQVFESIAGGYEVAKTEMISNADAWSLEFRRELQRLMKDKGVYHGATDGRFGTATRIAVEALASR